MDYPTKEAVLVRSSDGLPIETGDGYMFRLIGTTDQYIYCDVTLSSEEGWTCVSNPNEGYNYILFFNDIEDASEDLQSQSVNTAVENEYDEEDNEAEHDDSWDDRKTKFLLSLYKDYINLVRNRKIKTKAKMWEKIQTDFKNKNLNFSTKQIENRFKTLERRYKNLKINDKGTGRGRQHFEYKKELDEIFGNDPKNFPEMLMSAATTILREDLKKKYNIGSSASTSERSNAMHLKENVPDPGSASPISSNNNEGDEVEGAAPSKKVRRSVDILIDLKNDLKEQFKQKEMDREKKNNLIRERNIQLERKNDLFEKYMKLKFPEQEPP